MKPLVVGTCSGVEGDALLSEQQRGILITLFIVSGCGNVSVWMAIGISRMSAWHQLVSHQLVSLLDLRQE